MQTIAEILSKELNETLPHVQNVIELLDGGNTVPFIARYRKELHGSMDDQQIRRLADRLTYLRNLDARRGEIKQSIASQEKLTDELSSKLDSAATLAELEDLYRPYKPKRTTRASIAKEKGLMPLAAKLLMQEPAAYPVKLAEKYVNPGKGVNTPDEALSGARDIIAERLSDSADIRRYIKELAHRSGTLTALKAADAPEDNGVYDMYFDFSEGLYTIPGYRVLAINRGEKEGFLKVSVSIPEEGAERIVALSVVRGCCPCSKQVEAAAKDAWSRLIYPSVTRELRSMLTDEACEQAIATFAVNLKPLLMQPPVKGMVTMGLDPGYRTGCKVAVMDETGKLLDHGVVYPTKPRHDVAGTKRELARLVKKDSVNTIVIGNGTASRETEEVVSEFIAEQAPNLRYTIVNEAGASVYSASELASQEYPGLDVTVRGAMSLGRRLQDPLAELVKIPPQSIGVGQYQHDLDQAELSRTLGHVVEDVVNRVGVDVNTASASLLGYVSGITPSVAKNIVAYREENGIQSRAQLKKVPKLGPKAFEQCAGFLRVRDSKNALDATAVHPESYDAAKALLDTLGYRLEDIRSGGVADLPARVEERGLNALAKELGVGEPTLRDIVRELQKPGRDPRDDLPSPILRTDVLDIKDLAPGMELKGTVRNVIDFGAFVDIGVHQDGLVHISRMSNRFIRHPSEMVKVGDVITVWVVDVDLKKQRIALTMLPPAKK